jgi:hypothetical protein
LGKYGQVLSSFATVYYLTGLLNFDVLAPIFNIDMGCGVKRFEQHHEKEDLKGINLTG